VTPTSQFLSKLDKRFQTDKYGSRMLANGKYGPVKEKVGAIEAARKAGDRDKAAQLHAKALADWGKQLREGFAEIDKYYKKGSGPP
jgi:hypothetical protein